MKQIHTVGDAVGAVKAALEATGGAIGDQADELKAIAHQVLERVSDESRERLLSSQLAHDIQVFMDAAERRPAAAPQILAKVASIIEGGASKSQGLPTIAREDVAQLGRGRALRFISKDGARSVSLFNVDDIECRHRFMFGGIHDDLLIHSLLASLDALFAADETVIGREIRGAGVERGWCYELNRLVRDAAGQANVN